MKLLSLVIRNSSGAGFGTVKDSDFKRFVSQFDGPVKVDSKKGIMKLRSSGIPIEEK